MANWPDVMRPLQAAGEGDASQAISYLLLGSHVFRENSPIKASPSRLAGRRTGSAAASPHGSGMSAEQQPRPNQLAGGEDEEGVFGLRTLLRMAASRDSRTEEGRERAAQSRDRQWQRRSKALDIAGGYCRLEDAALVLDEGCRPAGEVNARRPHTLEGAPSLGLPQGLSSPRLEHLLDLAYAAGKCDAAVTMPRHNSGSGVGRAWDSDSTAASTGHVESGCADASMSQASVRSASVRAGNELGAPGTSEPGFGDWTPASGASEGERGGGAAASKGADGGVGGPRRATPDSDWGSIRSNGSCKTRSSRRVRAADKVAAEGGEVDRRAPAAKGAGGCAEARGAEEGAGAGGGVGAEAGVPAAVAAPEHVHATAQVLAGQNMLREDMARLHQALAEVGS